VGRPVAAAEAAGPPLAREFFGRPSVDVAPLLLGCVLESWSAAGLVAVALTEVEAYMGEQDPASHAYRGRTARNAVMYGMHFCVNLVCQAPGAASAVLLRAGAVVAGADLAARRRLARRAGPDGPERRPAGGPDGPERRPADSYRPERRPTAGLAERDLARGPARLCQALAIDRALDGVDACDPGSPLRIRGPDPGAAVDPAAVSTGPRVGVSRAADVPWRFWVDGDRTVSAYKAHVPRRVKHSDGVTPHGEL
jgi:DNA-3-methyladenine glycosylase